MPVSRATVLLWAVALVAVGLPFLLPGAGAVFTATTGDISNVVAADDLVAPTGFSAAQTCIVTTIGVRGAAGLAGRGSLTFAIPAGTTTGDLLVVQFTNRYDAGYAISISSGTWTLQNRTSVGSGANGISSAVYWRRAGASEPATVTFSLPTGGSVDVAGGLAVYTGVDTSAPVYAGPLATGAGVSATTQTTSVPFANSMLVHLFTRRDEVTSAPAGLSLRWRVLSPTASDGQGATTVDEPFAGTGPTTARTSTGGTASEWIAQTLVLRPVAPVPSATLTWTPSTSSGATGYTLQRVVGGTSARTWTVPGTSTTSTTDGPLVNATAYTYRLWTYAGTWVSPTVTATLTPSC
jgi:hypothetical protein